jgi:hypothetical protein
MNLPKVILLLGLIFHTNFALTQSPETGEEIFTVEALKEDFNFWRNRLESKHPLLYLYSSKATIDSCFENISQQIDHPMTELAFYKLMAPMVSMIKDGHNAVIPSQKAVNKLRNHKYLFPLEVRFIDRQLYVSLNLSEEQCLETSSLVSHINGVPSGDILDRMLTVSPGDGANLQLPYNTINQLFRFYYHLYYGFEQRYEIQYLDENKESQQCIIKGNSLDSIRTIRKSRYATKKNKPGKGLKLQITDSLETAIITIKTFDAKMLKKGYHQHFKRAVSKYFKTIETNAVSNLIIDLRNNNGGNPDYVKFILKHLFDEPFEQAQEARIVKDKTQEDFYSRTKRRWYPCYGIGTFKPKRNNYKGKIFVLINGGTFSAAVELAGVLQKYNRATFIGSETGGNPIIMAGYLIKTLWELPNTKIQTLPGALCTVFEDVSLNKGRGVLPDYEIKLRPEDLYLKRDKQLNFTLDLIKRGQ